MTKAGRILPGKGPIRGALAAGEVFRFLRFLATINTLELRPMFYAARGGVVNSGR